MDDILKDYQEVPRAAVEASKVLVDIWKRLGQPTDPFSESGQKMMGIIIAIWEDLYPLEVEAFKQQRAIYKDTEMSISQQLSKHTGRSLASYPMPIYQMMKAVFKGFDAAERKNCMKMIKLWPMFMFANRA